MKFRQRLREAGMHDTIFNSVVEHIRSQGLLVKEGTLMDATIIEAPHGRPRPDGTTMRDQDASFTSKHGVPHHGYKGHIGADLSGIVTGMMKQQLGYRKVRYRGMERNAFDFALTLAACNLKRSLHLRAA